MRALHRLAGEASPSWERMQALFVDEVQTAMAEHVAGVNSYIAECPASKFPDPFLSVLTRDCIGRARDPL